MAATEPTPRQREILALVAAGHSHGDVARLLGLSEMTVDWHMVRTYHRLGLTRVVGQRDQATVWSARTRRQERAIPHALPLTEIEQEAIMWTAAGLPNGEIAARMGYSVAGVKKMLQRAYRRLGLTCAEKRTRAAVLWWAANERGAGRLARPRARMVTRLQLTLIALTWRGLSDQEIARRMCMGRSTVADELTVAYRTLGLRGDNKRTRAAVMLLRECERATGIRLGARGACAHAQRGTDGDRTADR